MKISKFRLRHCLDPYLKHYVNVVFAYGDGNYGDDSMPHRDELYDIYGYDFEPTFCEGIYVNLNLENLVLDNEDEWVELDY